MELDSYFRGLLSNIEPDSAAVKKAKKAHEDLRAILQEDEEISKADPDTYLSGSYARDTALNSIKDVDVILLIEMDHNATEPEIVVAWLQEALQRHYAKVRPQGRSVQVTTETGFDLDVVPSVPISNRDGPVWIPDREVRQWVATHPKGQLAFGVEKNDSTDGYYKPLVKILKYWRDRLPSETARAKSYILESLVAGCLLFKPQSFGHGVVEIFRSIFSIYSPYLSLNIVPKIQDPGYSFVNVAKRWKFNEFSAFITEVKLASEIAVQALNSEDKHQSIKLWKKLFGNKFEPKD
jgi:predicted nucleotidyltransferase